ncbi:hypothetical protein T265_03452 [Opisthorchis viverrini]|uniref:DUF7083 domain-containing protein n=1 Tax=Opisthorchis viverrini TaxID=6198 RepID=A0A074ZRP2_OPIVI|nr:hypothetical protein T265_03452 [Opisthorchis viverrini]KER30088.1 hypothetical protein T265_03452 [Opisthorchis viverrini]
MSISAEDLKSILQQQQAQFEQSQLRLIQPLTQVINLQTSVSSQSGSSLSFADSIAATITEFHYEPASGLTFDWWYSRWEDTFLNEFTGKDDAWKSRLLVRKLGTLEHDRFTNFILPQNPKDLTFAQTVDQLREIFGDQHSLFNVRYNCLKLAKREADDYVTFAGIVNRELYSTVFNVHTLKQAGQHIAPACSLDSLSVDVCYLPVCNEDSRPSTSVRARCRLYTSTDPEATAVGPAEIARKTRTLRLTTEKLSDPDANSGKLIADRDRNHGLSAAGSLLVGSFRQRCAIRRAERQRGPKPTAAPPTRVLRDSRKNPLLDQGVLIVQIIPSENRLDLLLSSVGPHRTSSRIRPESTAVSDLRQRLPRCSCEPCLLCADDLKSWSSNSTAFKMDVDAAK